MTSRLFLFAHGAGAPSTSDWMKEWAERLSDLGRVERFDYPYMKAGKKMPDRMPKLIDAHLEALEAARTDHDGPVFLIGKSMGGRVGCHVAQQVDVNGVICLGYPLAGMGNRNKLRVEVLETLETPTLFVQGTRDKLFPLDLFEEHAHRIKAPYELYIVEGGDHSLRIPKRQIKSTGVTQVMSDERAAEAIGAFVRRVE